tara:strand:+ start:296 stop:535 length:240 start_codon:yes stop_codon:yes gene_type:complete
MKIYFVVRGSEDGNLGVHSNLTSAYRQAKAYTEVNGGTDVTLASIRKDFNNNGSLIWELESREGYGSANIEGFYLNHQY